ncbi:MAG: hypothetical protein H6712_31345 [Myxococcales bacterium]|nr:hypothetical protein [Myxococcales bacterium]
MKHDAKPDDRLRAIGGAFGSTLAGHIVILNLLKRWHLLTSKTTPEAVEAGWDETYPRLWARLSQTALGHVVPMQDATRAELYQMARSLVAGLDKLEPRADWYPDGWASMAAMMREAMRARRK